MWPQVLKLRHKVCTFQNIFTKSILQQVYHTGHNPSSTPDNITFTYTNLIKQYNLISTQYSLLLTSVETLFWKHEVRVIPPKVNVGTGIA